MQNFVWCLIIIALLGSGCSSPSEELAQGRNTPSYHRSNNGHEVRDIAMPPKSFVRLKESLILGSSDSWVGRFVYETNEEPSYMVDFLTGEMPKLGWSMISHMRSKVSILVFKKGGRIATVQVKDRMIYGSLVSVDMAPESHNVATPSGSSGVSFSDDLSSFAPEASSSSGHKVEVKPLD